MRQVLENVETSPLSEAEKGLFRFLDRVNRDSPRLAADDLTAVRAAGWSDEQLYYAITVCALFNFYNRWIDATGVHAMSEQAHREGAVRMAKQGYAPK
ncbi:MAG: hypothetical protein ACT4P7_15865 [Gemmatimonadaceae bacterium]